MGSQQMSQYCSQQTGEPFFNAFAEISFKPEDVVYQALENFEDLDLKSGTTYETGSVHDREKSAAKFCVE